MSAKFESMRHLLELLAEAERRYRQGVMPYVDTAILDAAHKARIELLDLALELAGQIANLELFDLAIELADQGNQDHE